MVPSVRGLPVCDGSSTLPRGGKKMERKLTLVSAFAVALVLAGTARAADFTLGFDGCTDRVTGAAGETKTFTVFATLTTTNNDSPDGAQGWSIGISATGGQITEAILDGVVVSTIFQKD